MNQQSPTSASISTSDLETSPLNFAHQEDILQFFGEGGVLSQSFPFFKPRSAQIEMAGAVAHAIENKQVLLAEAGTGTGKTFAYLIPALMWGGKVIISTGTKNLQDQLFLRDIPSVKRLLKVPVSVALLKGRANYICKYHLTRNKEVGLFKSPQDVAHFRKIERFEKTTFTGDKAELSDIPENAAIWSSVTSSKENCAGSDCAYYQDCFLMKARKEAQQADVVVVNHHLFFADCALKETGVAELLPSANTIIFDEAHQLPETASLFFGETLSSQFILDLCRDIVLEGLQHARDAAQWPNVVSPLEKAVRDLRLLFSKDSEKFAVSQIAATSPFFKVLEDMYRQMELVLDVVEHQVERSETLEQCRTRMVELMQQLQTWHKKAQALWQSQNAPKPSTRRVAHSDDEAYVFWIDIFANSIHLNQTPLSIAPIFEKQREGGERAWIFSSATMAVKKDFTHYVEQMGLHNQPAYSWPSPFDYSQQAMLYVPEGMPEPHAMNYTEAILQKALPLIKAAGGKTFLLCTTLKAVNQSAQLLREIFEKDNLKFPLFVQGELGRTELLERFRQAGNGVLIGSQSFWEGVDVKGQALSLVVIDKIPFSPPDDPVLAARIAEMEKNGFNGFVHYQLPEAIINLKQGAGRLIRDENDRGVLMIGDPRIISKNYGRRIWQSLPNFARTRKEEEVIQFFEKLNTFS